MYHPVIRRFATADPLAENYYSLTPYQYAGNTPINAIDIAGRLFVFVNGFMKNQWLAGRTPVYTFNHGAGYYAQNNFYNPNRGFYPEGPRNGDDKFDYWQGVDAAYMNQYDDDKAYYTNGSFTPRSTASARFNSGAMAGQNLINKLDAGEISLQDGETIKIIGHSQGAAYAAGIASTLAKHEKYGGLLEFVDYLSPHQPGNFKHPWGVKGRQFSTKNDKVSSVGPIAGFAGESKFDRILGTEVGKIRNNYDGEMGGHYIETWLDDLTDYWRNLGISVTVYE